MIPSFCSFPLRAFIVSLLLAVPVAGQVVTRVMPLGDSITDGFGVPGGYRDKLYQTLTTAGFNVDFGQRAYRVAAALGGA